MRSHHSRLNAFGQKPQSKPLLVYQFPGDLSQWDQCRRIRQTRFIWRGELSNGFLFPSAGFHPQAGQIYTIVEKTSPGVVRNEFLGPEGTVTPEWNAFRLSTSVAMAMT